MTIKNIFQKREKYYNSSFHAVLVVVFDWFCLRITEQQMLAITFYHKQTIITAGSDFVLGRIKSFHTS